MIFFAQYACANKHRMAMCSFTEGATSHADAIDALKLLDKLAKPFCPYCGLPLTYGIAQEKFETEEEIQDFMELLSKEAIHNRQLLEARKNRN